MDKLKTSKFKTRTFFKLAFSEAFLFWKKNDSTKEQALPAKFAGYVFMGEIKGDGNYFTSFKIGIYKNEEGRLAVAKMWSGIKKNKDFYWLINEARAYQGMEYLYGKYGEQIQEKFPDIVIPKMIDLAMEKNRIILLVDFLDGEKLKNVSMVKKIEVIQRAVQYFYFLENFSTDAGFRKFFLQRNPFHILLSFIFSCLKALARFPWLALQLFKAASTFFFYFPQMLKRKCQLVHRDLTLSNILLAKNGNIQIIDFGLAVFADRMLEIASIVEDMQWFDNISREFYKTKTMEAILSDKKLFRLYQMFSLYTSIYAISVSTRQNFNLAHSYFKHILNLKI